MTTPPSTRRPQPPTLVAAFLVGALAAGIIVPLFGVPSSGTVELGAGGAPSFLTSEDPSTTAAGGAGTAATGGAVGSGAEAQGGTVSSSTGAGPSGGTSPTVGAASDGGTPARPSPPAAPAAPEAPAAPAAPAPTAAPQGTAGAQLTATARGVTAEGIKIGVLVPDCPTCDSIGFGVSDRYEEIVEAFEQELNGRGGINGRTVNAIAATSDPVADAVQGGNSDREACLRLTEGEQVFAALLTIGGGGTGDPSCYYGEHQTFTIAAGADPAFRDPESFNTYEGRYWTPYSTGARTLASWADWMVETGFLEGRRYGIVADDTTRVAVEEYLIATLAAAGYPETHYTVLPFDFASIPTAAAAEQSQMRTKNVDLNLMVVNGVAMQIWTQQAVSSGYHPEYTQSDYPGAALDFWISRMPEGSWDDAIAYSATPGTNIPRDASAERCYGIWEAYTGEPTADVDQQTASVTSVCSLFHMFERGATLAGPNLTDQTLAQALSEVGTVEVAEVITGLGTLGGPYGFGSVKFSAIDHVAIKQWDGETWVGISDPIRMTR